MSAPVLLMRLPQHPSTTIDKSLDAPTAAQPLVDSSLTTSEEWGSDGHSLDAGTKQAATSTGELRGDPLEASKVTAMESDEPWCLPAVS